MSITLLSSPLQGITDFRFRNAFNKYFGNIDIYYAPYIRLNGKLNIKPAYERDLLPKNNQDLNLIPQIMTNDADEFLYVAKYIQKLGYSELNWNLGCPYPMVTKRGMGSGLIKDVDKIDDILKKIHAESDINVSIKMRFGLENKEEIFKVLPVLEKYPLKDIAIHPRIGKQKYKGEIDLDTFEKCIENTNHKIIYNGDIYSVKSFKELAERFPMIDTWMIGRGIIANPFLAEMIKNNNSNYPANKIDIFSKFHDTLFNDYEQTLSGQSHIIMKMYNLWEYFIFLFPNSKKGLKKIKKSKNIESYQNAVRWILNNG